LDYLSLKNTFFVIAGKKKLEIQNLGFSAFHSVFSDYIEKKTSKIHLSVYFIAFYLSADSISLKAVSLHTQNFTFLFLKVFTEGLVHI